MAGDDDDDDGGVIEFDEELEMKKQKMRAQQFEEEYKNKGRKKKPMKKRVFGPMWVADHEAGAVRDRGEIACEQLIRILKPYRAISLLQTGGGQIPTARSSPAPSPSEAAASAKVELWRENNTFSHIIHCEVVHQVLHHHLQIYVTV